MIRSAIKILSTARNIAREVAAGVVEGLLYVPKDVPFIFSRYDSYVALRAQLQIAEELLQTLCDKKCNMPEYDQQDGWKECQEDMYYEIFSICNDLTKQLQDLGIETNKFSPEYLKYTDKKD